MTFRSIFGPQSSRLFDFHSISFGLIRDQPRCPPAPHPSPPLFNLSLAIFNSSDAGLTVNLRRSQTPPIGMQSQKADCYYYC